MEKSSQIAWKIVPLIHFFPLKVVPLIEVLLYSDSLQALWTIYKRLLEWHAAQFQLKGLPPSHRSKRSEAE
jgi:hypothetical protein